MLQDFLGREITEGAWVVRSFNLGRCAALKYARVVKLKGESFTTIGFERETWRGSLEYPADKRLGTSTFPERCFIIEEELVPLQVKESYNLWLKEKG